MSPLNPVGETLFALEEVIVSGVVEAEESDCIMAAPDAVLAEEVSVIADDDE